jgi:hypothetical protein
VSEGEKVPRDVKPTEQHRMFFLRALATTDKSYRELLAAIPRLKNNSTEDPVPTLASWATWNSDRWYLPEKFHLKDNLINAIRNWAESDPFYNDDGNVFGRTDAIEAILPIGLLIRDHRRVHFTESEESEKLPTFIQTSKLPLDFLGDVIKPLCVRFTAAILESTKKRPPPAPEASTSTNNRPNPTKRQKIENSTQPVPTTQLVNSIALLDAPPITLPRKRSRYAPTPTDLSRKLRSGSKKDSRR